MHRTGTRVFAVLLLLAASRSAFAAEEAWKLAEKHLQSGTLADGETALAAHIKQQPKDDQARFALGTIQFLRSVEGFSQSLYKHGFLAKVRQVAPFLIPGEHLPIPDNPDPAILDYKTARGILQKFVTGLETAEQTLSKIESTDWKFPLHFGLIRLDLDGDGVISDEETLWKIYTQLNRRVQVTPETAKEFVIAFDLGDVYWLRGYCHLLMALGEINLAHDTHDLFERAGHLIFANVKSPHPFLAEKTPRNGQMFFFDDIVDVIALIHLINFPVVEPKRMQAALVHLEAMTTLSRRSWDLILRETDDDNEWLPNPKQTGVIPNVRVTAEMIDSWKSFLAEMESILKGDRLIPFWRGTRPRGVNLRRVFTEPQPFDLVMWIQGTGATPYLEEGTLTDMAVWDRLQRVFQGEFIGFAFWFN